MSEFFSDENASNSIPNNINTANAIIEYLKQVIQNQVEPFASDPSVDHLSLQHKLNDISSNIKCDKKYLLLIIQKSPDLFPSTFSKINSCYTHQGICIKIFEFYYFILNFMFILINSLLFKRFTDFIIKICIRNIII